MKINKCSLQQNTELNNIWNPHMMLNTMVYNFVLFEGDLAEKWPYKHEDKIMKYIPHFLTSLYYNFINPLLCRVFADRVT